MCFALEAWSTPAQGELLDFGRVSPERAFPLASLRLLR